MPSGSTYKLHGLPTVDRTHTIAASDVEAIHFFKKPGRWLIQNMGPFPAFLRMLPLNSAVAVTAAADMPLWPAGSGDRSEVEVTIAPEFNNLSQGHNELHVICNAGETASLKATLISKSHMA